MIALTRYARAVLRKWLHTGEIFNRVRDINRPVPPLGVCRPNKDDFAELIDGVIGGASHEFRSGFLAGDGWSPDGTASMQTYFVTGCLYAFKGVYGPWRRTLSNAGSPSNSFEIKVDVKQDTAQTIEDRAVIEDLREAARQDGLLEVLEARLNGDTYQEIGARQGVTGATIEGKFRRFLNRFQRGNM